VTVGGTFQALGMREVRGNLRAAVERVEKMGQALVVLRDGQPSAVMLSFAEASRWGQIERAFAAFHGLDLFPELARDTAELGPMVRGETHPSATAIRALARTQRAILGPLRTMGITDVRSRWASILDEIEGGRSMTIVSSGRFAATLVSPVEYDRLRALDRTVSWFATAGLDLATADEAAITEFVREYRTPRGPEAGPVRASLPS
jgi:antitoxin (DNA-binding transcriptional repressor) of toxin-antitoxin stability system